MSMSEDQKRQKEEAMQRSKHDSYCIDATGQRKKNMPEYEDQINNE